MPHVSRPSIIDVEASGFGPQGYPIEVGVAMGSGETYSTLILSAPEWTHWDREADFRILHFTRLRPDARCGSAGSFTVLSCQTQPLSIWILSTRCPFAEIWKTDTLYPPFKVSALHIVGFFYADLKTN